MRFVEYDLLGSIAPECLLCGNSLHAAGCNPGLNRGKRGTEFQATETPGICRVWVFRSHGQAAEPAFDRISIEPQLQYLQVTVLPVVEVGGNG